MVGLRLPAGFWSRFARVRGEAWRIFVTSSKASAVWLVPMLATAGATAYLSYIYNQKANTLLVIQQQKMTDLQQFRVSGGQLDQALGRMSDAVVDGFGLEAARREMRSSIGRHIADTEAVRNLLGSSTDSYLTQLADLRVAVDEVGPEDLGQSMWQSTLNIMAERRRILKDAERRAVEM